MNEAMFQLIVQGGSFALLAYVVLYAVRVALPARDKAFIDALELQRTGHEESQKQQRSDHREIQNHDRSSFEMSIGRICESNEKRTAAITTRLEKMDGKVDQLLHRSS